jgi:arabinose-5-phosphate isomerase
MHSGANTPIISISQTIKDALIEMSAKGLGMTAIVDHQQQLAGLFTDGDLRRILEQRIDIHSTPIAAVMTESCTTATPDMLAAEALNIMEHKRINGLIVINELNQPIGALNMQDLLKAGVL